MCQYERRKWANLSVREKSKLTKLPSLTREHPRALTSQTHSESDRSHVLRTPGNAATRRRTLAASTFDEVQSKTHSYRAHKPIDESLGRVHRDAEPTEIKWELVRATHDPEPEPEQRNEGRAWTRGNDRGRRTEERKKKNDEYKAGSLSQTGTHKWAAMGVVYGVPGPG
ncbi:hypothetical protein FA13DRAFT_1710010 [Coprinellus micaceus]|uniref:Uncharacterized protein n=1 Tax=Coprinellus micaceus TaxID=71717 RepID=A0A4Y7TAJ1_COPMI|nr:hypothetical protein FA13DRAFT_1710010 [Coprinellus micaceus]